RLPPLLLALALAGACATATAAPATEPASERASRRQVRYDVAISGSRWVEIVMTVERPRGLRRDLALPAWIPGSYLVRDLARGPARPAGTPASCAGRGWARTRDAPAPPALAGRRRARERLDKRTWRARRGGKGVRASYRVWAGEPGVRPNSADDRHASRNGPGL